MAASKIIVSTSAAVTEDGPISGMEEKHEFILQDEKYACKSTFIIDADAGIGMVLETTKSCIKVEPADDGGMVVKVERSYKLLPPQDEVAETHEKIIAESTEMGGASNFKVKLD